MLEITLEPRLDEVDDDEAYRIVVLPSFMRPLLLRFWRTGGERRARVVETDGRGGFDHGSIARDRVRPIDAESFAAVRDAFDAAAFFDLPRERRALVLDGERYVFEARRDGRHHVVDRRSFDGEEQVHLERIVQAAIRAAGLLSPSAPDARALRATLGDLAGFVLDRAARHEIDPAARDEQLARVLRLRVDPVLRRCSACQAVHTGWHQCARAWPSLFEWPSADEAPPRDAIEVFDLRLRELAEKELGLLRDAPWPAAGGEAALHRALRAMGGRADKRIRIGPRAPGFVYSIEWDGPGTVGVFREPIRPIAERTAPSPDRALVGRWEVTGSSDALWMLDHEGDLGVLAKDPFIKLSGAGSTFVLVLAPPAGADEALWDLHQRTNRRFSPHIALGEYDRIAVYLRGGSPERSGVVGVTHLVQAVGPGKVAMLPVLMPSRAPLSPVCDPRGVLEELGLDDNTPLGIHSLRPEHFARLLAEL